MVGLHASHFRRVYVGLLLGLVLLFLMPAVIAALLAAVVSQLRTAGIDMDAVRTVPKLLAAPVLAVRAMYAALMLQYCLAALCALLVVSGLGELESASRELSRAKRWFVLLMVANGVAMLAHISDLMLPDDTSVSLGGAVYFATLLLLLVFQALALRALERGYAEVLRSVGAPEQSRRARSLSRSIAAAVALLGLAVVAVFCYSAFALPRWTKGYILGGAVGAFLFYLVCRIQVVCGVRTAARQIAALSE
ncbi:MAG: hypothetical protein J5449_12700 [Oscillospiraceae bacterium]|nr:hypothetical protein [Oscillospiraceae bacterium]